MRQNRLSAANSARRSRRAPRRPAMLPSAGDGSLSDATAPVTVSRTARPTRRARAASRRHRATKAAGGGGPCHRSAPARRGRRRSRPRRARFMTALRNGAAAAHRTVPGGPAAVSGREKGTGIVSGREEGKGSGRYRERIERRWKPGAYRKTGCQKIRNYWLQLVRIAQVNCGHSIVIIS